MKKIFFIMLFIAISIGMQAQKKYEDGIRDYIAEYVQQHEVVKGDDKKLIQFFPVSKTYRVVAKFEPIKNGQWFNVPTSSGKIKTFRQYGKVSFKIHDTLQVLYVYQSQALLQKPEYWDYLSIFFTDKTNETNTYNSGRYIDFKIGDIKNNKVIIDFNKAYNPYCAYVSGVYNCPIPPEENTLTVAIKAGEKRYLKPH